MNQAAIDDQLEADLAKAKLRTLEVQRSTYLKRNANQIARMMRRAGMSAVRVQGVRGNWTAVARATTNQLARFASDEATREQGR